MKYLIRVYTVTWEISICRITTDMILKEQYSCSYDFTARLNIDLLKAQNTSVYFFTFPVDTLRVRDRRQLCLASVNLLHTGKLQVKGGSPSLRMICVCSYHTAKQFRVFAITSNKVLFVKNFSRKKYQQITDRLQWIKSIWNLSPSKGRMSITWTETLMFFNMTAEQVFYLITASKQIADKDAAILQMFPRSIKYIGRVKKHCHWTQ